MEGVRRKSGNFHISAICFHGNAIPHSARLESQKLDEIKREVLPHSPYTLSILPIDFHLFRSRNIKFEAKKGQNSAVAFVFFCLMCCAWYVPGINLLEERWENKIKSRGE